MNLAQDLVKKRSILALPPALDPVMLLSLLCQSYVSTRSEKSILWVTSRTKVEKVRRILQFNAKHIWGSEVPIRLLDETAYNNGNVRAIILASSDSVRMLDNINSYVRHI